MSGRTRLGRRAFLRGSAALSLALALPSRAADERTTLRLLKVRHSTFLVELGGVRALLDPCFSRDLGLSPFVSARPPALEPERAGRYELLLVTSGRADHFDARALSRLGGGRPWCFAPDDDVARALRDAGHRRVRVVKAGDVFEVAGVEVSVSPSQDGLTGRPAVGYRLARGGRALWHTGAPPPLDVFAAPVSWARAHPSEVVLACWDAFATVEGRRITMSALDGQILAALAGARVVVPSHDDARATALGGLLLSHEPGPDARSLPGGPRVVVVEHGVWYRVAEDGGAEQGAPPRRGEGRRDEARRGGS